MRNHGFWSKALIGLGAGLVMAAVARGAWPGAIGGGAGGGGGGGGGAGPVIPAAVAAGPVTMTLGAGSARVLQGSPGELVLDVEMAAAAGAAPAERGPSIIAVVVDRSGSMAGDKLEKTKNAVAKLLERLGAKDRVALIAYDSGVETVVAPSALEADGERGRVGAAVRALEAGGSTNISGALETAASLVRGARCAGEAGRVLLLTDGLPTAGVTDPAALARIARAARETGVDISTFGVGVDFNERLMLALSDAGGGTYAYIEDPGALGPVFERELARIASTAARDVRLSIELAAGVELLEVFSWPHERDGSKVSVRVGDIEAGRSRHVTMRLKVPTGAEGAVAAVASARVELRDAAAADAPRAGVSGPLVVACTPDPAAVAASRDAGVLGQLACGDAGSSIASATLKLQEGDREGAKALLSACVLRLQSDPVFLSSAAGATATARARLFYDQIEAAEAGSLDARRLAKEGWSEGTALQR
jgi:Ca-activated chloride channel family protein